MYLVKPELQHDFPTQGIRDDTTLAIVAILRTKLARWKSIKNTWRTHIPRGLSVLEWKLNSPLGGGPAFGVVCVQQGRPIFDIELDEPKFEEGGFSLLVPDPADVAIPVTDPAGVGMPEAVPAGVGMPEAVPAGVGMPEAVPAGVGMPERVGARGIFDVAGSAASVVAAVAAAAVAVAVAASAATVAASTVASAAVVVVSLILHFYLNNFFFFFSQNTRIKNFKRNKIWL